MLMVILSYRLSLEREETLDFLNEEHEEHEEKE